MRGPWSANSRHDAPAGGSCTIGAGAALGAKSGVMHDAPAGARWVGAPAKPVKQFFREVAALERLAGHGGGKKAAEREEGS